MNLASLFIPCCHRPLPSITSFFGDPSPVTSTPGDHNISTTISDVASPSSNETIRSSSNSASLLNSLSVAIDKENQKLARTYWEGLLKRCPWSATLLYRWKGQPEQSTKISLCARDQFNRRLPLPSEKAARDVQRFSATCTFYITRIQLPLEHKGGN